MTFIGTETQPPVNQFQTGHYNATRLLVQPLALNAVRRFLWTALTLKVRQLFSQALSHSFLPSCSFSLPFPFPCIPSLFCDDLIPAVSSLSLSLSLQPSNDSFLHSSLLPFLPQPDEVRVQLEHKQPLQAIHSDLITQHCRVKCLNQFHNYPSLTSPSYFLVTTGSSKQLGGQLSKQDAS